MAGKCGVAALQGWSGQARPTSSWAASAHTPTSTEAWDMRHRARSHMCPQINPPPIAVLTRLLGYVMRLNTQSVLTYQ